MKPEIKALTFDVFGTVVDWRSSIIEEGNQLNSEWGWELNWEDFADRWRGMYQPSMEEVRSGKREWVILDTLHRESLHTLLEEFGCKGVSEERVEHLNRMWHRLRPWSDSVEGLEKLKNASFWQPSPTEMLHYWSTWPNSVVYPGTRFWVQKFPGVLNRCPILT